MLQKFNIRVYGILVNERRQVLVSDECIHFNNRKVTKFPGGGLELGEGTIDGLKRECREEMGIDIAVEEHLYTTDYFQQSAFDKRDQLIAIYYRIRPLAPLDVPVYNGPAQYPDTPSECFRFVDWPYFNEALMSLPADKIAARLLKQKYN